MRSTFKKSFSICLLVVFSCMILLCACGHKTEDYEKDNKDFIPSVQQVMDRNGLSGEVSVEDSIIYVNIDATDVIDGIDLTPSIKDNIKSNYDTNLTNSEQDILGYISQLREETGDNDLKIKVTVMLNDEELTSKLYGEE